MRYYRGKQYELQKKVKRGGDDRKSAEVQHQKPHNEAFDNIAHELAVQHKVSKATIERDAVYAKAIDTLADVAGPGARQALLGRETKVTQQEVKALAKMATKHALTAKETLDAVHEAKTPKQARQIVREKVREVWEHEQYMDALARSNVPEDEWPASLRAKHTPAPADGLAPHFQRGQRSLETLKTCLTMVSLPDALDHHTEACIALGKACREVESLMTEHPAVCAALLGKPAAPMKTTTALAAPAASVSRKTPRPQRKPGALSERILEALHQHQPCINAKLAQTVDSKPKHTHKALLSLLKQGKVHKEGQQYWVVEALKGTTIAACVAEAS